MGNWISVKRIMPGTHTIDEVWVNSDLAYLITKQDVGHIGKAKIFFTFDPQDPLLVDEEPDVIAGRARQVRP